MISYSIFESGEAIVVKPFRTGVFYLGIFLILGTPPFFIFPPACFSDPLTVNDTSIALNMDGHLEDWPACRMIDLNQDSQVVDGKFFWKSPDQFSGRVFLTYDSEFLYVALIVTRPGSPVNNNKPSALWNGDCLELFLSGDADSSAQGRLTRADYHIGLSPGTNCVNPEVWCFNRNEPVAGARVKSKNSKKGYILEAALPLSFFKGFAIGPGKSCGFNVALDVGGALGSGRLLQMDYSGYANSWQGPAHWSRIQWIGQTRVEVPLEDQRDENYVLVKDGSQGAVFLGPQTVRGLALDAQEKPLAGAFISTWPASVTGLSDASGQFILSGAKVYRQTVVYAQKDGYDTSLGVLNPLTLAATIHLSAMPVSVLAADHALSTQFFGADVSLNPAGEIPDDLPVGLVKNLGLNILFLKGESLASLVPASQKDALKRFVDYALSVGAQPAVEVPLGPDAASEGLDWLKDCGGIPGRSIHVWALGNEPDRGEPAAAYNVYDYVNDFRDFFNLLKREDPTLTVMGPNLASDATDGEGDADWLTPFLKYDGDIVNLVSVHHYAALANSGPATFSLGDDANQLASGFRALQGEVSQNSNIYIPAVYSKVSPFDPEAAPVSTALDFKQMIWRADVMGTFLQEGVVMAVLGDLEAPNGSGFFSQGAPNPSAWVTSLFSKRWRGHPVPVKVLKPFVNVYASRDDQTGEVSLFILNESSQYDWFNISLDGKGDDLVADAGVDAHFRLEVPDQAVASLKIRADGRSGDVEIYTGEMAKKGQAPELKALRP